MLFKNVASQKIHIYAYDSTTGAAKTGDAANITGYVSLDGTANALDDTNPAEVDATNMPGVYVFDLAQAETNCSAIALSAKSTTANIRIEPIIGFTTGAAVTQTGDSFAVVTNIHDTDLPAVKAETAAILVDTGTTLDGRIPAALTANGNMKCSMMEILATALTETSGYLAAAFKKFFNIATPASTMDVIARVTLTDTTNTNTDMRGTDNAATATNLATVDTVVDAIKAKTDSLTFTAAGNVDSNVRLVNDVTLQGNGTAGNTWRPV